MNAGEEKEVLTAFETELVKLLSGSVDFFSRKDGLVATSAGGRGNVRFPLHRLVSALGIPILQLKAAFVCSHHLDETEEGMTRACTGQTKQPTVSRRV